MLNFTELDKPDDARLPPRQRVCRNCLTQANATTALNIVVLSHSFNMKKVRKGAVTFKLWDIGGCVVFECILLRRLNFEHRQARFRNMWQRYARGANAILCVYFFQSSTMYVSDLIRFLQFPCRLCGYRAVGNCENRIAVMCVAGRS